MFNNFSNYYYLYIIICYIFLFLTLLFLFFYYIPLFYSLNEFILVLQSACAFLNLLLFTMCCFKFELFTAYLL